METLKELAALVPVDRWSVVGGQMVAIHAARIGVVPLRPTTDDDIVVVIGIVGSAVAQNALLAKCRIAHTFGDMSLMTEVAAVAHPGHLIRERRHALGWSQHELAQMCGVTQADLSRIENGHLDARWSTIQRIMAVISDPANTARRSLANGAISNAPRSKSNASIWQPSGPVLPIGPAGR